MKIRFKESTSAYTGSKPGMVRDVPDPLGRYLVKLGQAEETGERESGRAGDGIETATVAAPETTAARPRRRRRAPVSESLI